MKLYELKRIIKEEIDKEQKRRFSLFNTNILSTACTLDDLHKEIEKICKKELRSVKYEIKQDDGKNMVQVKLDHGNYRSNDLTFIQKGQTDENVYKRLKDSCNIDFGRFYEPLSKFCTGILKVDRPSINMSTQHSLPVSKVDEKTGKTKYYMYRMQADLVIGGRGAKYNESKEETNQRLSDDSVRSISDISYVTFFLIKDK